MIRRIGSNAFEQLGIFKYVTTPRVGEFVEIGLIENGREVGITFKVVAIVHGAANMDENVKPEGDLFLEEVGTTTQFFIGMDEGRF